MSSSSTLDIPSLTLKVSDLLQILNKTDECEITKNNLIAKYQLSEIEIERRFKKYDEILQLPCSEPNLSVKVSKIQVLSEDDYSIKSTNTGLFEMTSSHVIETSLKYHNCSVINEKVSEVNIKVKSKELKVLENFNNDKIFCFFDDYILVYILEDQITNIVMIQILQI